MMLRSLHPIILIILFCDLRFIVSTTAMLMNNVATIERKHPEEASFVEYFKDHEVSEKQARENLRGLKENDFATPAYCKACSLEHRKYCISENLLKDHCCCNQSHNKEQLYFIPHTCFINEDPCYPSLGSCLTVSEIRNCCCDAKLKKHWKSVLSDANTSRSSKHLSIILAISLIVYGH